MIMNVDTVRDIIMETKDQNFSRVEYEGEQVLYCLRIKPLGKQYSLFPVYSMEYTTKSDLEKMKAIANAINESHDFRADVMYRKVDVYSCQKSRGGWERYEE